MLWGNSLPLQGSEKGKKVTFSNVLLVSSDGKITVGTPHVSGASVEAEVVSHGRDDKIRVQKFARRKRYRRVHGHRQDFTEIKITKITA